MCMYAHTCSQCYTLYNKVFKHILDNLKWVYNHALSSTMVVVCYVGMKQKNKITASIKDTIDLDVSTVWLIIWWWGRG